MNDGSVFLLVPAGINLTSSELQVLGSQFGFECAGIRSVSSTIVFLALF